MVKIGEEEITEIHQSGNNVWRNGWEFHPVCDCVPANEFLKAHQTTFVFRTCSGFLGVLHVRPGPHILWSTGQSSSVSWNPAIHNPACKPHRPDLRWGSSSTKKIHSHDCWALCQDCSSVLSYGQFFFQAYVATATVTPLTTSPPAAGSLRTQLSLLPCPGVWIHVQWTYPPPVLWQIMVLSVYRCTKFWLLLFG